MNYGRRPCVVHRSAVNYYGRRPYTLCNINSVTVFVSFVAEHAGSHVLCGAQAMCTVCGSLKSGRRPLVTGKSFMIGGMWFEDYNSWSSNNNAIQQCIVWACGASIVISIRIRRPNDIGKSARIRQPDETEKNYLPMPFTTSRSYNCDKLCGYALQSF